MAILNATNDSFYAPSRTQDLSEAIAKALKMQAEGADILDIGGESTRPGAIEISVKEELERTIPLIHALRSRLSIPISIDTSKPEVASAALEAGAEWVNDVTGFIHPEMISLSVKHHAHLVVMHMQGTPRTMQQNPVYPEGIIPHLINWFAERIEHLLSKGVPKEKIILDPGIGFGKTIADNLKIIHNLQQFRELGFRVLLGISRKSFMGKQLNKGADNLLPATIALNSAAILYGIDIIRVHDVSEHRAAIDILETLEEVAKRRLK